VARIALVLLAAVVGGVAGWFAIARHVAARAAPSEPTRRLSEERSGHHVVAYVLIAPAEQVREALPPSDARDASAPLWSAALPGAGPAAAQGTQDTIVVADRGAATAVWLADPWDLAAATERPPRLARFDAWLRAHFPGRHIISGDDTVLGAALAPGGDGARPLSPREADKILGRLDRQEHDRWRVIN
jgi:hypothetical protein